MFFERLLVITDVSQHRAINCKPAGDRYKADYPHSACQNDANCDPFAHFNEQGKMLGRVWHSEL